VLNAVLLPPTVKGNLKFRSHTKQNIKHDCASRQQNKQTNNVTVEIGALNKIVFLFIENLRRHKSAPQTAASALVGTNR
jgi:5-methylcytosine-specific restriction endonuclease McrBC regulatory subunit McrC